MSVARPGHYVSDSDRDVLVLHSSGTTGTPKAIRHAHRFLLSLAARSGFDFDQDWTLQDMQEGMAYSTIPLFHCFGLLLPMMSLSIGKPFALPLSGSIPFGESIVTFIRLVEATSLFTVPSLLRDVVEFPAGIDVLKSLKHVIFGGSALDQSVGEKLSGAGVKLIQSFGTTEIGNLGVLRFIGDWRAFRVRTDHQCELHELADSAASDQPSFHIKVRPPGWAHYHLVNDYFTRPSARTLRPEGRADDIIVLENGLKVHPRVLEDALSARADVQAALAFGEGQLEIGVLVEPAGHVHSGDVGLFRRAIWPTIEAAARLMEAHARITSLHHVVVLQPGQREFQGFHSTGLWGCVESEANRCSAKRGHRGRPTEQTHGFRAPCYSQESTNPEQG